MGWLDGLVKNWAELDPESPDRDLRPVEVPCPVEQAVSRVEQGLSRKAGWCLISAYPARGFLHATHKTRLWRFVDDVHLQFEPVGETTRIVARSQSRIGKGDFGQNARNLKALVRYLRAEFGLEA